MLVGVWLRQEFGFKITEALTVAGRAEGVEGADDEASLLEICQKASAKMT